MDKLLARRWADFYRARGWNPLPSRTDAKRPYCRFAEWWESPAPSGLFVRWPQANIQIMTGRHWRLLVIDLDGNAAVNEWARMGQHPRTWITHSGGNGRHVWFTLPPDYPTPLPKATLWQGDGKHSAIERLCDKSLVMAPPSVHPETGRNYRFLDHKYSPKRIPMPAICPPWVLGLRPVEGAKPPVSVTQFILPARAATHSNFGRSEVLAAIPDKIGLAKSWGVKIAGRTGQNGWAPCHAIDREDVKPSAAIHHQSGHYVDRGSGTKMSLFDLGIKLGVYRDFNDAISDLGSRYAS